MEIGRFLKLKRAPQENPEEFFAIQIDPEFVKTAIWTVRQKRAEVIAFGTTSEWDGSSTQILIEAIDNSLSIALEKLEEGRPEPNKAVFGLPETWVSTDGVASPRLSDLKAVCEKLALKPLGFVVTTEAISHYLKMKEGTPLSAVLLRVSTSEVSVTIVHLGNIEGTHVAGRSGDLAADVREGIVRFGERESLPSRMLLFNGGEDLQDLAQELLAYDWQGSLPFLHIPKIEALEDVFSITAVSMAGGAEVAKSLGFSIVDILPQEKPKEEISVNPESSVETAVPEIEETAQEVSSDQSESGEETEEENASESPTVKFTPRRFRSISRILGFIPHIAGKLIPRRFPRFRPSLSLPFSLRSTQWTIVFVLLFLSLIGAGAVVAAKRIPKATVVLTVEGQTLHQRLTILATPSEHDINLDSGHLPAEKITLKKTKEGSKDTTGTKTTGEKARGEVSILNKTNAVKKFSSGTTITAPNGKEFTLDSDITVASQSAQETSTGVNITFGTGVAPVTAGDLGPEFNIDASTEFKVSNLSPSAFLAKNNKAFAGGTKQEVRAVSKKDQTALKDELVSKIQEEAKQEIESQSENKRVFAETINVSPTKQEYSADAGSEADKVSLKLTADVTALAIQESDFQNLLASMLANNIPEGFTLVPTRITTQLEEVNSEGDDVKFDAVVTAQLAPMINEQTVLDGIVGKRPAQAAEFAKKLPYFKRLEISFSPTLPPLFRWVPQTATRISYQLKVGE